MKKMYMCVSVDFQPEGLNLSVWFSPIECAWVSDVTMPYQKIYYGDYCMWSVRSNIQLTPKIYALVTDYADRICLEQKEKNDKRKLANR